MMALGNLFQTNFELGAPEAGWVAADQVRAAQQQQDLANAFQQLQNERYGQMTPLELQIKGLEAAQAGQLNTPEMLDLYGKAVGAGRKEKVRADEIAALQHPLLRRLAELNLGMATGEAQPTIGFPVTKQVRQPQPGEVTLGGIENLSDEQQVQIAKRLSANLDILNNSKMPEITKQAARKDIEALQQQYPAPTQYVEQSQVNAPTGIDERERLMRVLVDTPEFRAKLAEKQQKDLPTLSNAISAINAAASLGVAPPDWAVRAYNLGTAKGFNLEAPVDINAPSAQPAQTQGPLIQGKPLEKKNTSSREARYSDVVAIAANEAKNAIQNITQMPFNVSSGLFGAGRKEVGLFDAPINALKNTLTKESTASYNAEVDNIGAFYARLIGGGVSVNQADIDKFTNQFRIKEGESALTALTRLAQMRQSFERAAEVKLKSKATPAEQLPMWEQAVEDVKQAIPITVSEVNTYRNQKNPTKTFKDFISETKGKSQALGAKQEAETAGF